MLQGGAEGGRVRLTQGHSGGDLVPVKEEKVCLCVCVNNDRHDDTKPYSLVEIKPKHYL